MSLCVSVLTVFIELALAVYTLMPYTQLITVP